MLSLRGSRDDGGFFCENFFPFSFFFLFFLSCARAIGLIAICDGLRNTSENYIGCSLTGTILKLSREYSRLIINFDV